MTLIDTPLPAVTLLQYAKLMRIPLCGFFGVYCDCPRGCTTVWTQAERDEIAFYLRWSQELIEAELNYPLTPRWMSQQLQNCTGRLVTAQGRVLMPGIGAQTLLAGALAVNTANDPVLVTVAVSEDYAAWQVRVTIAGTEREIPVESASMASGVLTIQIPRCVLVREALVSECAEPAPICTEAIYESAIDIYILSNDPTQQALVQCQCGTCCGGGACACCTEQKTAALCIENGRLGIVRWQLAEWDAQKECFVADCGCAKCVAQSVEIFYLAGLTHLTLTAQMAVIGLAHALMPEKACQCQQLPQAQLDRRQMGVIGQDGSGIPVRKGMSDPLWGFARGAVLAWEWVRTNRLVGVI